MTTKEKIRIGAGVFLIGIALYIIGVAGPSSSQTPITYLMAFGFAGIGIVSIITGTEKNNT